MRCTATTILFLLTALAMTLFAVSHFVVSEADLSTEYPTGREWAKHRQKAEELEKKMRECKDPVVLETLCHQHVALIEQWKKRTKPIP